MSTGTRHQARTPGGHDVRAPPPRPGGVARGAGALGVRRDHVRRRHTSDYNSPGTGSAEAAKLLKERFAGQSGDSVDIVWRSQAGATSPATAKRIDALLGDVSRVDGVASGTTVKAAEVSDDGDTAVVRVPLDRPAGAVEEASGERIAELVKDAGGDGIEVAADGTIGGLVPVAGSAAEMVGILVAGLVLLVTFGTVVAAGLPLLMALFGVAVSVMSGLVLATVVDTPDWAMQVSIMIGLGVGIDYALLVLTRFRAARSAGRSPREANVEAMTTAGHSALVAGGTVVIALGACS